MLSHADWATTDAVSLLSTRTLSSEAKGWSLLRSGLCLPKQGHLTWHLPDEVLCSLALQLPVWSRCPRRSPQHLNCLHLGPPGYACAFLLTSRGCTPPPSLSEQISHPRP